MMSPVLGKKKSFSSTCATDMPNHQASQSHPNSTSSGLAAAAAAERHCTNLTELPAVTASEARDRRTSLASKRSSTARCIFFSCQLRLRRGARPSSDCACGARDAHDAVCGRWCANLRNACDSRDAHRSVPRARGLARSRPLLGGWMRRRTRRRSRSRGSSRAPRPPPRPRASSTD